MVLVAAASTQVSLLPPTTATPPHHTTIEIGAALAERMARRLFPDSRDRCQGDEGGTEERQRKDLRGENKRTRRTKVTRLAPIADPPHVISNVIQA